MGKQIATAFSVLFHPLAMPTLLFSLAFYFIPSIAVRLAEGARWDFLLVVFLLTGILPALFIYMLRSLRIISSVSLFNRKERYAPFTMILVFYGAVAYMFSYQIPLGAYISAMFFGITLLILSLMLVTLFFKISIHSASVWGIVGFMIGLNIKFPQGTSFLLPVIGIVLIAGAVSSSRLYLNAHQPSEVGYGAILGFVISFAAVLVLI